MVVDLQRGSKIDPRSLQDSSKRDKKVMYFSYRFLTRFGIVWGVVLGGILTSKIDLKSLHRFTLERPVFDLVIGWSQNGRQDGPKRAQELPRAAQDPPKTLPRGPKSPLSGRLGSFWGLFWIVLGFDSLIRFIDSIY